MTQAEFNKLDKAISLMAKNIMGDKGPEYTLMKAVTKRVAIKMGVATLTNKITN